MKDWQIAAIAALAAAGVYIWITRRPEITPQNWQRFAQYPNAPGSWKSFGGGYGGDNVGGLGWE